MQNKIFLDIKKIFLSDTLHFLFNVKCTLGKGQDTNGFVRRTQKKKKKGMASKIIATVLKMVKGSNNVGDNPEFLTVDTYKYATLYL